MYISHVVGLFLSIGPSFHIFCHDCWSDVLKFYIQNPLDLTHLSHLILTILVNASTAVHFASLI